MNSATTPTFSVDLVEASKSHIEFLRTLHSLGVTLRAPSKQNLHRYLNLWIPLVAEYNRRSATKGEEEWDDFVGSRCGASEEEKGRSVEKDELVGLVPPSDVAWLWHCHRLAPQKYIDFLRCQQEKAKVTCHNDKEVGNKAEKNEHIQMADILEADPPFSLQHLQQWFPGTTHSHTKNDCEGGDMSNCGDFTFLPQTAAGMAAATNARILWEELYPSEPFFNPNEQHENENNNNCIKDLDEQQEKQLSESSNNLQGFDLLGSAERQRTFIWQISAPSFNKESFLQDGEQNYHRFLLLKTTPQGRANTIVPTYQIDLMWHTHILSSIGKYNQDCRRLLGGMTLHHDDSLVDRAEGSKLDVGFRFTNQLWLDLYGKDYFVEGGMYRGEPPLAFYNPKFFEVMHLDLAGKIGASSPASQNNTSTATSTTTTVSTNNTTRYSSSADSVDSSALPSEWISPNERTPDDKPAFIPPSHSKRNNRKKNYVFGRGSNGAGYYHISTKDANVILHRRLVLARRAKQAEVENAQCVSCLLCSLSRSRNKRQKRKLRELDELDDMLRIAKMRANADVPLGAPKGHQKKYKEYYGMNGEWLVPAGILYAAACGARKIEGGGAACGGGALGAPCGGAGFSRGDSGGGGTSTDIGVGGGGACGGAFSGGGFNGGGSGGGAACGGGFSGGGGGGAACGCSCGCSCGC